MDPTDMMMFQKAFIVYFGTQGYEDFTYQLTVSEAGLVSCAIEPDLDNVQKSDILNRIQTLKNVTVDNTGEYVFV